MYKFIVLLFLLFNGAFILADSSEDKRVIITDEATLNRLRQNGIERQQTVEGLTRKAQEIIAELDLEAGIGFTELADALTLEIGYDEFYDIDDLEDDPFSEDLKYFILRLEDYRKFQWLQGLIELLSNYNEISQEALFGALTEYNSFFPKGLMKHAMLSGNSEQVDFIDNFTFKTTTYPNDYRIFKARTGKS